MSVADGDPIAFVEACYNLDAPNTEWLQAVADAARPLMRAGAVLAYHVDLAASGFAISDAAQSGNAHGDVVSAVHKIGEISGRVCAGTAGLAERWKIKVFRKVTHHMLEQPVDHMLLSEMRTWGPRWGYTLGVPGVNELHFMCNHHIDGQGVTYVVGALDRRRELRQDQRTMFLQLGAHLKAGLRLRRRLRSEPSSIDVPEGGAVLDASSRVVEARGEASSEEHRSSLARRAQLIDRARAARTGRDVDAVGVWQGLVEGRWSLVERVDSDGKRFMLAYRNPEQVTDPRGLSELEVRVARLALRGYANKLIAYHLGISESVVSVRLAQAMRKLRVTDRVELIRALGPVHEQESGEA